ncbi:MAG: hypothetical protein A2W19_02695 [Spirochaetes bacterium RBG_16_49_21]|nr:MAG: hypothetical protein A2W19_02695 [Spirochaetes bacterium RBG_16_49_21]
MNIILIIILLFIILILIWALMGGRADLIGKSDEELKEEEITLRRRAADKEIEKEYPESSPHARRRKSDHVDEPSAEEDKPFKLPYPADEIIPESSRSRIYRRTLVNSEIYAGKGDYSTALSLFEGVKSRIQDIDTRFKIDANVEYLKHFKKKKEEEVRKREEDAKKGIAGGVSVNKGEITITFGGSVPNAINLGVVDPAKNLDMDAIVDNVSRKLRGEITEAKEELGKIKSEPPAAESGRQELLADEQAGPTALSELKDEIQELGKAVREIISDKIPEASSEPALTEARFDSSMPYQPVPGPAGRLQDRIPKQEAPGPTAFKGPFAGAGERVNRKTDRGEEEDDFELLSDYGREKEGNEPSDEEIFEKILREDKPKEKEGFEIIGEKKERGDEYVTTNEELDLKEREDESFYRRLLRTNKRKKKELPILKVSYDFTKLPDEVGLSREKNIIEYAFYKYKPMLEKADEFIKKRKVRDAINYYKVVISQNIPPEFKSMVRRNLNDLTEYLEKYLSGD